ncbi:hypothetical protein [Streptomyces sp. NBC_00076]
MAAGSPTVAHAPRNSVSSKSTAPGVTDNGDAGTLALTRNST